MYINILYYKFTAMTCVKTLFSIIVILKKISLLDTNKMNKNCAVPIREVYSVFNIISNFMCRLFKSIVGQYTITYILHSNGMGLYKMRKHKQ